MKTLNNWELLRVLLETSRAGGFRRAQTVLGLTQPTIGKKIDELERQVGSKLLIRTNTGVSLTPAGESLRRIAQDMEKMTQRALDNLSPEIIKSMGRVSIAVTDGMAGYWLPRRLRRFHREHPHITLDVHCIGGDEEVDLSKREADITVMYRPPTDPDVVIIHEAAMELAPLCTKEFVEDWGRPSTIEEVLNVPVLAHPMHYMKQGNMRIWAEMLERHSMVLYRTASSVVLAQIAKMGIGLSLQPVGILDREEGVMMLDIEGFKTHLPFYLVSHKSVKDVPAVRTVINYLRDSLFKDDGLGSPSKKT